MKIDAFWLARSIQKHVKRVKSAGYSHPPIIDDDEAASFRVTTQGRRFEVRVREISLDEELEEARKMIGRQTIS